MSTDKLGVEAVRLEQGGLAVLQFPRLGDPKVLSQGVSTRLGGVSRESWKSLNLSYKVGDEAVRVDENRGLLSRVLGMDLRRVVFVDQVHSDKVVTLTAGNRPAKGGSLGEADAIITQEKGIPILIQVADCLPVLFYDPVHQAVGLAHAGWRGTVSHIAAKTLLAMGEAFGTRPEETRAVLGPCIGACCYEVGAEVQEEVVKVFPWGSEVLQPTSRGHWRLDLAEANARQLLEVGMKEGNLVRSGLCTIGRLDLFYSHRAEAGKERATGRFGAFLMLKDQ